MNPAADVWSKVITLMQPDMTATTINTWFDDASAVALEDDRFVLYSPTRFKRDIIATRYVGKIQAALRELFSCDMDVVVLTEGELDQYSQPEKDNFFPGTEEYTFERFVVGSSNKFAHAAARAVADNPGKSYNPLFIYGESGLGKTHLLYAIAHTIHKNHPEYKVVYIKGDTFTNELIQAIREGRNAEFREKYRGADVFLMDDVQFIAGRDSTQEEMFHTFNTLYELKKQIVFTSDRPPKEMLRLEDRLKTRFEWGLLADIQRPDYETRMAIIKNKAIRMGMELPDFLIQLQDVLLKLPQSPLLRRTGRLFLFPALPQDLFQTISLSFKQIGQGRIRSVQSQFPAQAFALHAEHRLVLPLIGIQHPARNHLFRGKSVVRHLARQLQHKITGQRIERHHTVVIDDLPGLQLFRILPGQHTDRPCLKRNLQAEQQKQHHAFPQQRMTKQTEKSLLPAEQKPHGRKGKQHITGVRQRDSPRIVIDTQPASGKVLVKR